MRKNTTHLDRKLIPFFHTLSNHHERNMYSHMFREDICLAITPIGARSRIHPNFSTTLEGADREIALAILESFSDNHRKDLNSTVCNAIDDIAKQLSWRGHATFEILKSNTGEICLEAIAGERTYKIPFVTLQFVPRQEWATWNKKIAICPNKKIWQITIPKPLGGRSGYNSIISNLNKFSAGGTPKFHMEDLERNERQSYFNISEYTNSINISIGRTTKAWGWNRRDWSTEHSTEYYNFYRMINFRKAQAALREHIIKEINTLFSRLHISCTLSMTGIPTYLDIVKVGELLKSGEIDFNEASRSVSL
ncbi:hypothetical protein [Pseudomonas aeruginosa]|uniref:hypothetical protein n=1 Tax=Pseudomonas aeruginosa TaxID=287 RepID=UPI0020430077|nr:hypothetical protein [Pseudomonas aeruginosa]MCM3970314.1 hypothetical protein [Pseudomonas aeruginosa]MCM4036967.1 hypothetical protein [Pseudomonas aeruginosa]MCM4054666.1 hypothetical protein [Pseudomonas aeruginosa]